MQKHLSMNKFKEYWKRFTHTILYKLIASTVKGFIHDNPMLYGASIAFYTIFSMPAILIFIIYFGKLFFRQKRVEDTLYEYIEEFVGSDSAEQIQNILQNAQFDNSSFVGTTIAVITLIVSATTVFVNVQFALNAIWGVRAKPEKGWLKFILDRVFSFVIVASLGIILMAALLVDTVVNIFQKFLVEAEIFTEYTIYLTQALSFSLVIAIVALVFALVFKLLPDAYVRWRDVWVGSLVTSLLFIGGKELIGIYLAQSTTSSVYGAASSLVFLLVWIYYSTVIFLIGAEFTKAYSEIIGKEIRPRKNAVRVIRKEIEKEVKPTAKDKAM